MAPHFSHAPGSECAAGFETALHLAAKQLIEERALLAFPLLFASIDVKDAVGLRHRHAVELVPAAIRRLDKIRVESVLDNIRPDLIVEADGLGEVVVEIAVTHFVDADKAQKIRDAGLAAVEIDVSMLRDINFGELERLLFLESSETRWIHHPRIPGVERDLIDSIQDVLSLAIEEDARRTEAVKQHHQRMAASVAMVVAAAKRHDVHQSRETAKRQSQKQQAELKRATAFRQRPEFEKAQILQRRLGIQQLPEFLRAKVRGGQSFGVKDELIWQTTLFGGLIHQQVQAEKGVLRREQAAEWLRHRFTITPEYIGSEKDAIWDYFSLLTGIGAIVAAPHGDFRIAVADLDALAGLILLSSEEVGLAIGFAWADAKAWPTSLVSGSISSALRNVHDRTAGWNRLTTLGAGVRETTPAHFCAWALENLQLTESDTADYLVRAGFIRLQAPT